MAYKVKITPEALEQAEQSYFWILEQSASREIADRWFNGLIEVIDTLTKSPERCAFAPENGFIQEEVRQLLYGKHKNQQRIIFTLIDDSVHVLHIRNAAMRYLHEENSE